MSLSHAQVFTTIYLAETLRANVRHVEETPGLDQNLTGLSDFTEILSRTIAELERRYRPGGGTHEHSTRSPHD